MVGAGNDDFLLDGAADRLKIVFGVRKREVLILFRMDNQRGRLERSDGLERVDLVDSFKKARRDRVGAIFAAAVSRRDGHRRALGKLAEVRWVSEGRP